MTKITMTPATTTFADNVLIKRALAGELLPKATDPEDLCQDVLLKVWRHLPPFGHNPAFARG